MNGINGLRCAGRLGLFSLGNSGHGLFKYAAVKRVSSVARHRSTRLAMTDEKIKPSKSVLMDKLSPAQDAFEYDKSMDMKMEPLSEDFDVDIVDQMGIPAPKTFNLAAYADRHWTLQKLIDLGVDLSVVERKREYAEYYLNLNFDKQCRQHIRWLHDHGIPAPQLGQFVTHYPMIFAENIENLDVRIKYLETKRFSREAIKAILVAYPPFLSISIQALDARLGFLKDEFRMEANDVRSLVTRWPKVVAIPDMKIRVNTFAYLEEMGFTKEEYKQIILTRPSLLMIDHQQLVERFDYLYNVVSLSNAQVATFPELLSKRLWELKQRSTYLKKLGRDQFDPTKPGYTPPGALVTGTDAEFCERYSKTSVADFNLFLKSL